MYEIYANTFLKENVCAHQVFLCALISQPVCARTRAQLRGNIASNAMHKGELPECWDLQAFKQYIVFVLGSCQRGSNTQISFGNTLRSVVGILVFACATHVIWTNWCYHCSASAAAYYFKKFIQLFYQRTSRQCFIVSLANNILSFVD